MCRWAKSNGISQILRSSEIAWLKKEETGQLRSSNSTQIFFSPAKVFRDDLLQKSQRDGPGGISRKVGF